MMEKVVLEERGIEKDCNAVDLPNYGVLEIELRTRRSGHLWKMVHKYAPEVPSGKVIVLLSIEDVNDKQWSLNDDEQLVCKCCSDAYDS